MTKEEKIAEFIKSPLTSTIAEDPAGTIKLEPRLTVNSEPRVACIPDVTAPPFTYTVTLFNFVVVGDTADDEATFNTKY